MAEENPAMGKKKTPAEIYEEHFNEEIWFTIEDELRGADIEDGLDDIRKRAIALTRRGKPLAGFTLNELRAVVKMGRPGKWTEVTKAYIKERTEEFDKWEKNYKATARR